MGSLAVGDNAGRDVTAYQYQIEAINKWLEQQSNRFREIATPIRPKVEWRSAADIPVDFVAAQARAADIAIIARGHLRTDPYYALDPGAALLTMGRPVLTVPPGIEALQAQRIVIAWKDTREARRAVREALPLLREAREVFVIKASDDGSESQAQKHVDDVAGYLVRHRVIVAAKSVERIQTTAAAELIRAAQTGCGQLLMFR